MRFALEVYAAILPGLGSHTYLVFSLCIPDDAVKYPLPTEGESLSKEAFFMFKVFSHFFSMSCTQEREL